MSDVQRLKAQLHQLMTEAQQGAASLGGFKQKFSQHSAQVQALIAGSATGADRDIAQVLDAASKAIDQAVESLQIAAAVDALIDVLLAEPFENSVIALYSTARTPMESGVPD